MHTGAHFWIVSCCLLPHLDRLLTPQWRARRTKTRHNTSYVDKMATLSLVGVFQKPEGWIAMPQVGCS